MRNWLQSYFKKKKVQPGIFSFSKGGNKKNALIIYAPWAVKAFRENVYKDADFVSHSMHWESIEMIKTLVEYGYDVDYADCLSPLPEITWKKYNLIIDERNNLAENLIKIQGIKIFYSTGCYWSFHNNLEEQRIDEFNKRFHLNFSAERKVEPILSAGVADITTYFGNDFQKLLFPNPQNTFSLNLSTVFLPGSEPVYQVEERRKNFIWMGSRGFIHKGLDIVVESFVSQPDLNLHICTELNVEPEFYAWFKDFTQQSTNIFYHGFLDVTSSCFSSIITRCIAIPYLSCAEGGGGAVLQAMQFNCFPIVCESTALRGQEFGMVLKGNKREDLLGELNASLNKIRELPVKCLEEMTKASGEYARKNHSRKAYAESFIELLTTVRA